MSLPDRQRAVATLYYVEDLSVAEIAEALDIAPGTVRFHLSEAREQLRSLLEETDHVG
jgi:RNA polymerase sigma-70 factor (ECF subfamily)